MEFMCASNCALWPQMSPLPLFPNMNSCSAFYKPRLPASLPAPPASVTTGLCLSSLFNLNKELGRQRPAERQPASAVLRWAQGVRGKAACWRGHWMGLDPEEARAGEVAHRGSMDKGWKTRRQSWGEKQREVLFDCRGESPWAVGCETVCSGLQCLSSGGSDTIPNRSCPCCLLHCNCEM